MANFVFFVGILLIAGVGAVVVLGFVVVACLSPLTLFKEPENAPRVLVYPLGAITGVLQICLWGFWAAFCVAMTIKFTQKPEVTWDWVYWITGFVECTSPIFWLAHKELQTSQSSEDDQNIKKMSLLYSLFANVAFLVFAFVPGLMRGSCGWFLKPLGL